MSGPYRESAGEGEERPAIWIGRQVNTKVRVEVPWVDFVEWLHSRGVDLAGLTPHHIELVVAPQVAGPTAVGLMFSGQTRDERRLR